MRKDKEDGSQSEVRVNKSVIEQRYKYNELQTLSLLAATRAMSPVETPRSSPRIANIELVQVGSNEMATSG